MLLHTVLWTHKQHVNFSVCLITMIQEITDCVLSIVGSSLRLRRLVLQPSGAQLRQRHPWEDDLAQKPYVGLPQYRPSVSTSSIKLLTVAFLTKKLTLKVKIPLFMGLFASPTFQSQPVWA